MNALELRRRTLGKGVYKKTVEGNPAIAQGSLARRYPGITMQGWTEQDSYDGKNLLPVDVGQEFIGAVATDSATFEEDGVHAIYESIVSGEARDIYLYGDSNVSVESGYVEVPNLTPGDYRLVNDNTGILLYVVAWRNGASVVLGYVDNATTKITIQDGDKFRIFLRCNIPGDTDVKIHPMIVKEGDDTTVYEPYTGGQPSPNPDYPQPITSAGKYDEASRKYQYTIKISDSEESPTKSQTVTLTSDRPLTKWDRLEKRDGVWGWVYKSDEYTMTGEETFYVASESYIGELTSDSYVNVNNLQERNGYYGFSNYLKIYVGLWNGNFDGVEGFAYNGTQIHVRISNEDTGIVAEDTVGKAKDKIKAYCAQRYADGTPFIFWHETTEETFVPLSETEQDQMNELYTFRPTTVLSNDCECEMTLTYKTKKSLEVAT